MESEEQCDLETLEALLEDSDDECVSAESQGKSLARNNDCDDAELDILASLVTDDCDIGETSSSVISNQTTVPVKPADPCQNNQMLVSVKPATMCKNRKSSSPAESRHNFQTPDKSANLSSINNINSECNMDSSLTTTQSLLEEMARMQQKMLEMQKMLEKQQQQQLVKQHSPHNQVQHGNVQSKLKEPLQKIPVKNNAGSREILPSSGPNKTENLINGTHSKSVLRLLPDNDDSFFSQTRTSSLSTPQPSQKEVKKVDVSSSKKVLTGRDEMKKDLFGDSDSDWEMDGEDKHTLSEAGKDMQQLLHSNQRKRDAHESKFSMSDNYTGISQTWSRCPSEVNLDAGRRNSLGSAKDKQKSDKNTLQCKASSNDQANPVSKTTENEQLVTENFSKIRIVNPLISSSLMKLRMEGRKMIDVSRIHMKLKTPDLQGDWVTVAVIVGKTDSKSSSSGKPYSIWKLNNLEDLDNSVSFFLFGEVHKHLWKLEIGTVIGVLNPSIMESMEKKNSEPAFTIKNPGQLMIMGRSKDLGWCAGRTKKGNKCGKFINMKFGDSCVYHVQQAYRKVSAARLEFHGSIAGVKPKSFEQKIFSKDCAYMYGGQTFVPHGNGTKTKKNVTLSKLQKNMSTSKSSKVSTMSIQNIKPEPTEGQKNGRIQDDTEGAFIDMISVPSPGSMNLVAFLKNKDKKDVISNSPIGRSRHSSHAVSITPDELIKQHQKMMQQKKTQKIKASDLLLADSKVLSQKSVGKSHQDIRKSTETTLDALSQVPVLAKGFYGGQDVSLDLSSKFMSVADRTKLKAVLAIKEKGGIRQEDPNATKKSEPDVEKIQKRVISDCDKSSSQESSSSPKQSAANGEPPKKKSRLLGNMSLNSDEIKNIMKARSKHKGAVAEAEAEREEVYFNELEKKEKLEEKMQSITSIEITVITCKQCLYTAQSAKDTCKAEGHLLTRSKTKKRFFMCKKCKHRTYIIGGKFPTECCRKCGALAFEKSSMCKPRTGPKLESEVLNLRGDEVKYLNSMDHKVFLQTVVDN